MHAPGQTGTRLRIEISSSEQAVANLKGILDQHGKINKEVKELQMHAIQILTELASDSLTNLSRETKGSLIDTQMQIFLAVGEGEEAFSKSAKHKVTAGKTLALLSKTETASVFIIGQKHNVIARLGEILESKNNMKYKTIAAEILENLCTTLDKKLVEDLLLPKALTEVLTYKREAPTEASAREKHVPSTLCFQIRKVLDRKRENQTEAPQSESAAEDDEEKQLSKHNDQIKSEKQTFLMEWQEALLSLTLVICNRVITPNDSDDVAPEISIRDGGFVATLNTIVQDNCQATSSCLRIVKLCGQIALLIMLGSQNTTLTQYKELVESLSMASEIMSNLESCMLFAGTDCGMKNSVRPLLFDLEKELKEAVESFERNHGF